MTYAWDAIKTHIARIIGEAAGFDVMPGDLAPPPTPDLGDLAYPCFGISKVSRKSPADVAKSLAKKIKTGTDGIASVSAAGPYLNVTLEGAELVGRVIKDVECMKASYGKTDSGKGKQLMLEYAQPNTHKEIHVGHLRNLVLGASLARIIQANGWDVVTSSYHGDIGAHVAKCLWLFVRRGSSDVKRPVPKRKKGETSATPLSDEAWADHLILDLTTDAVEAMLKAVPKSERNGKHLGELYAEATKLLEENPDWKTQVSDVQRRLEGKDTAWTKLWRETRRWSLQEMEAIFEDIGVAIDRQYLESEMVEAGLKVVGELLKTGIAKESEGAIIVDLTDEGLDIFLIRKSDGTTLYATKDLALAKVKFKDYPKLARNLIVVDNRQSLYFRQLFATLRRMGFDKPMEHIGYEFVTLKGGSMSSRSGNVVTWPSFREEILAFATAETSQRHLDWNQGRVTHTAWCLLMGGMKFGMLKQDGDKAIVFDMEKALSFDGATGPYIQYATTRLGSILMKANWEAGRGMKVGDLDALEHPAEKRLALAIATFPRAAKRAADELRPSVLAQWCLDMATRSNEFYRDVPVIDAPLGVKQARLRLVASARTALILGLTLLGIPIPEEM
ncbi:arginine--tRNA ligase [Patescibacteria group bacterium]|nr:arginine--tRNA ligase [Patescibacteria group bacterium]MBU1448430.1 arginine--tRNA ligase [Patescibacteria group bacterium]MBU2612866.1 arginine--tRNA ligase [Patescibacteria group bacterium]